MSIITNEDNLECLITDYGLSRIAAAIMDPSVTLKLEKMKVGDANGTYYVPVETQTSLVNPILNGEFYVLKKELLEDSLTVSFQCVIPEEFGGYDIREVGLFETTEDGDKLFAIVTQQPIVKPSVEEKYFITVDYYMFLKAANLAEVYDQIILDSNNQIATEEDLENLLSTLLFTQGNLSVQIGANSEIIGYNRPTEVYSFAVNNRNTFGYLASCNSYASFANYVGRENVFGYWIFDYPNKNEDYKAVQDLGYNGYKMSVSKNIALFEREYQGISPSLVFSLPSYYYLDSSIPLSFVNSAGTGDLPFTIAFLISSISASEDRTLLARSNYAVNSNVFEIKELSTGAVQIKLFTNPSNYITFTSAENVVPVGFHSLVVSYDNLNKEFLTYINGIPISMTKVVTGNYTHMYNALTTLYGYYYNPYYVMYTHSTSPSTSGDEGLYYADGSPYEGTEWTVNQNQVFRNGEIATYTYDDNVLTSTLYSWVYDDGIEEHIVYTKTLNIGQNTKLYNSDYTENINSDFYIAVVGSTYKVLYTSYVMTNDGTKDIPPITLYAWVYYEGTLNIWANSSSNPTVLFNNDGSIYPEDNIWKILNGSVVYVPTGESATYNSSYNITVSNLDTTSYIVSGSGEMVDLVNSKVSIIGVALAKMSEENMRIFSMELGAQVGQNPCISPS